MPSALLPVAVGPTIARSRGGTNEMLQGAHERDQREGGERQKEADLLRSRRHHWPPPGGISL